MSRADRRRLLPHLVRVDSQGDEMPPKLAGAHIGDSLEAEGWLRALEQALESLSEAEYPIHHSDRGCQYCCHAYVKRLQARELPISMTQIMHGIAT